MDLFSLSMMVAGIGAYGLSMVIDYLACRFEHERKMKRYAL